MIIYHRNTICKLLDQVKFASESPFDNLGIWKNVQLTVIKKIIQLENRIRDYNSESRRLNVYRKDVSNRLSKEESLTVKATIKKIESKTEDIRFVIDAYRSIGDAIAYTLINKFDIKPQNFKQSAGFISNKIGLKKELDSFNKIFKEGYIAILNDITSALKYCDITVVHPNGFVPIEIKTSEFSNNRVERQKENANKIFNYLNTDETECLYGFEGITKRVELSTPEINYIKQFNDLIKNLKVKNNITVEVENGVHYYISNKFDQAFMDENLKTLENPIMIPLNQYKFSGQGYYPFSLSFSSSSDYLDFLLGKFSVFIFVDFTVFEKHCNTLGYKFIITEDQQFGFALEPQTKNNSFTMIKMSNHYIYRTAFEFVSLKWLIEDSISQFKQIHESSNDSGLAQ